MTLTPFKTRTDVVYIDVFKISAIRKANHAVTYICAGQEYTVDLPIDEVLRIVEGIVNKPTLSKAKPRSKPNSKAKE